MVAVYRDNHESFESLLKRFRKQLQHEKVMSTVRRGRFFEKPSVVKKRKAAKKLAKSRKVTRKMQRRRY